MCKGPDACCWPHADGLMPLASCRVHSQHEQRKLLRNRYKGVSLHRDKFRARIKVNGKEYGVGLYYSEAEAARAVDEARIYLVQLQLIVQQYKHCNVSQLH